MAYQYVMPQGQQQQVDYSQGQQPQQQSNQGMGMMQNAMKGDQSGPLSNLFGGGDAYGFGGADPFSTASYAGGEGAVATGAGEGAAAGGGSSWSSMASSAGPWAALAAIIIGNEVNAEKGGFRSEDPQEHASDMLTGEVLNQDLQQRWLPDMFGEDLKNDSTGLGADMQAAGELGTLDFSNAWDSLKDGMIGKSLSGIGDLFK